MSNTQKNSDVKPVRKRRHGDRYDGYRVRNLDPMFTMIPYIMRSRLDSQILFEERIDITELEKFILEKRKEIPGLSLLNVVATSLIRTISQKPRINRFTSGGKIYARSYIRFSITIKQSLSEDGDESQIMPEFQVTDTLSDVVRKIAGAINETRKFKDDGNNTDIAANILGSLPGAVKRFFVFACRNLDKKGLMPKAINRLSPFHSSIFITQVGSLGIDSIYHHLYEFGTTSAFVAIGKKESENVTCQDGSIVTKKYVTLRFVLDERICDGFYYASAVKLLKSYLKNPEILLTPPEKIVEDI